ncbi:DUF4199 domain-containing protein [Jiulongibacter sp. NS-SX5]|uniref:DUF4199 domain-containing protein n=1 Tax=Jiulongibacter sp. NS-SX5 TaxID=3463854 RepID=UPI00405977A1
MFSKSTLKYGLIGGLIVSLVLAISTPFNIDTEASLGLSQTIGYASMIVALSFIYFGVRDLKNKEFHGDIGFKKALRSGVAMAVIISLMYTITWMIISGIYPEAVDGIADMYIDEINAKDITDSQKQEEIAEVNKMMENYENPIFKFGITLMEILPIGLLVALATAIILRTKGQSD